MHLPESYSSEPERRYPIVYVLDGTSQDTHTARSAALMARIGVMPEIIVAGLPNARGGRPRDYTPPFIRQNVEDPNSPMGRGDQFLAFLKSELIPHIESRYRTAKFRMLAGHSRGGLFVTYSLLADPLLFQARFAHSPFSEPGEHDYCEEAHRIPSGAAFGGVVLLHEPGHEGTIECRSV